MSMKLCIDLGATNVKGALIEGGTLLKTAHTPTDHSCGREGIISSLVCTSEALLCPAVSEVCVSSAGDIDVATGVCTYATGNLEDFAGFDFPAFYMARYGLKCHAANDGYCALLGEMEYGAGRAYRGQRVVMLTLGSGVGGAYCERGIYDGGRSNGAGKLGHLTLHEGGMPCNCGKKGCIEQYLSGRAVTRLAARYGIGEGALFEELRSGNPRALLAAEEFAAELGRALGVIGKVCPFDVCLLGGGVSEGLRGSLPFLRERVGASIELAALGNRAGLLGAYCLTEERT